MLEIYSKYISKNDDHKETFRSDKYDKDCVKYSDKDFGRRLEKLGTDSFERIACHHVSIEPGDRSSLPHSESLEEEFIYVLKGRPHLWLNGWIYELHEGFAVGFRSGTGINHSIINNTDKAIKLFVAGEKTKPENKCFFPLHEESESKNAIWWANAPRLELGPHKGMPGPIEDVEKGESLPYCIYNVMGEEPGEPFHYASDNETFGRGTRLSDKIGLKQLGIWHDVLPSGRRTAFPHAHTHEEEFVYILEGNVDVWMNGYTQPLTKGDSVCFPSNTGISHCLINNSASPARYLCVGESFEFPDEKICYPLNPLRNKECERKNWYWQNPPKLPFGDKSAKPQTPFPDHIELELCSEKDAEKVLEIFNDSKEYFMAVNGKEPTIETAKFEISSEPKQKSASYFKEFLIINYNKVPAGACELHANHENQGECYLGLLIIRDHLKKRGLGKKFYQFVEQYIRRSFEANLIKLGVSEENEVAGFWKKVGFSQTGETYKWKAEEKTTLVTEFKKTLENCENF